MVTGWDPMLDSSIDVVYCKVGEGECQANFDDSNSFQYIVPLIGKKLIHCVILLAFTFFDYHENSPIIFDNVRFYQWAV